MAKLDEPIKASEAVCGDFTFTYLGGSSMLVEKKARQQSLTLEETEVLFLATKLPKVLAMFQTDYNTEKRCFNCSNWHGDNKKYCPLQGKVGSDFYCKNYIPRSKSKTEKHIPDKEDGEQE